MLVLFALQGGRAMALRVSVLVECPIIAEGVRTVLSAEAEIEALSISLSFTEFVAGIEAIGASVVLVDIGSEMSIGRLAEITKRYPHLKIVLWLQSVSLPLAHSARELGVRGILRQDCPLELIVRCLKKVSEGETWFERGLMESLLECRSVRLSPREAQLLELVTRGLGNKQIAGELRISEGTVKVYFSKLFRKVGVRDRFELALYGLDEKNLSGDSRGRFFLRRIEPGRADHVSRPLVAARHR